MPEPRSERLLYERLSPSGEDAFHRLVTDPHVRRYMMDGQVMGPEWSREQIAESDALFARLGLGLWLLRQAGAPAAAPFGFAGYKEFEGFDPPLQVLYALTEGATGKGYATEAAKALLEVATEPGGPELSEVHAAVDEPNVASVRVLERLGFARTGDVPGAFGRTFTFVWRPASG